MNVNKESLYTDAEPLTLIVEPNSSGHRLYHVGLLIEEFVLKGKRAVILTTSAAVESSEWRARLGHLEPEVILRPSNAFTIPKIAQISAHLGAGVTILLDADPQLPSVFRRGWAGPGELKVLIIRPDLRRGKSWAKKALILGAGLRSRVRVFSLRSPLVPRKGPIRWVADPVLLRSSFESTCAIRERLDSHGDRYWFGVFGVITPRKNLPLLIAALSDQPDVGLLLAGIVDPVVNRAIAPLAAKFVANGGQLVHLSGPLTDADFDSAIGAVDCVVALHSNEGSSGVLLKGAASGRRLILAGAKSLRRDADYLGDQATWSPLDLEELRRATRQARTMPEPAVTVDFGAEEFLSALT